MHWLTAIFGFLACYSTAGLIYGLVKGDANQDPAGVWFWAIGIVAGIAAAIINQMLANRRKKRASS